MLTLQKTAKVGVYIPNRNHSALLKRALSCVVPQRPDDIVVVDDASEDDSREVVRRFSGVRLIEHPSKVPDHNAALVPTILSMNADYCIGMGADDILMASAIDEIRAAADKYLPGVVFTDYAIVDQDMKITSIRKSGFKSTTFLPPEEAAKRLGDPSLGLFECGVGAAVSRAATRWIVGNGGYQMGPWIDSIGNSAAACVFGAAYVPVVGAAFTVAAGGNWHSKALSDPESAARSHRGIVEFFRNAEADVAPEILTTIARRWGA